MKVSIVAPVYNEARYIDEAMQSILDQSYRDIEIIAVNDASTDNTWERLEALAVGDERLRIFNPGKLGKNGAINYGIEQCTGDWIGLMAGDDRFGEHFLEKAAPIMAAHDPRKQKVYIGGRQYQFSDDPKYQFEHGILVAPPSEDAPLSNTLGIISRALCQATFPLPLNYPNEDTWTALCYRYLADTRIQLAQVYINYRIHANNSFDHNGDFDKYNQAYHVRRVCIKEFCDVHETHLTLQQKYRLMRLYDMEMYRYKQKTWKILWMRGVPLKEKLKGIFFSRESLNNIKKHLSRWLLKIPH